MRNARTRHARLAFLAAVGFLAVTLGGCQTVPSNYRLAASDLSPVPTTLTTQIDKVHFLVQDSQTRCAAFVNSMYAQTAGSSLILDILSTSSSALATVFTKTSVTHAFSAAGTIFSGARNSLTAEYLNSLTISHIAQTIQSTYSVDIAKYIAYLDSANPATIDANAERSKILSYHNECSLAAAEGSISSSLQPANDTTTTQPSFISMTYKIVSGDTPESIANNIRDQINSNMAFKSAGITASATGSVVTFTSITMSAMTSRVDPPDHPEQAPMSVGPPYTLTISATPPASPRANDVITIAASPPVEAGGAKPAPIAGQTQTLTTLIKPGAAILGAAVTRK
jgi:hypothetical protein